MWWLLNAGIDRHWGSVADQEARLAEQAALISRLEAKLDLAVQSNSKLQDQVALLPTMMSRLAEQIQETQANAAAAQEERSRELMSSLAEQLQEQLASTLSHAPPPLCTPPQHARSSGFQEIEDSASPPRVGTPPNAESQSGTLGAFTGPHVPVRKRKLAGRATVASSDGAMPWHPLPPLDGESDDEGMSGEDDEEDEALAFDLFADVGLPPAAPPPAPRPRPALSGAPPGATPINLHHPHHSRYDQQRQPFAYPSATPMPLPRHPASSPSSGVSATSSHYTPLSAEPLDLRLDTDTSSSDVGPRSSLEGRFSASGGAVYLAADSHASVRVNAPDNLERRAYQLGQTSRRRNLHDMQRR